MTTVSRILTEFLMLSFLLLSKSAFRYCFILLLFILILLAITVREKHAPKLVDEKLKILISETSLLSLRNCGIHRCSLITMLFWQDMTGYDELAT